MGAQCGQHQHPDYLQLCTKGRQKSLDLPLFEMAYEGPELVEALTHRLFQLHDLNKNGLLEEEELEEDAPDVCSDGDPSGDRISPGL